MTGLELTEWHSGYRAYRVDALTDIDLDSYSNDFDFDTEIILGLHEAGKKIVEVPIPTYYGDEISHVNGIRYAKDVTNDVLRFKARRMGFGTGPSGLSGLSGIDAHAEAYELKPSPHSSHGRLLAWTARLAPGTTVLDVGLLRRPVRRARPPAGSPRRRRRPGQARTASASGSTASSTPTSASACPPAPRRTT